MLARTAKGVVIVVGPTQAKRILALLLDLGSAVTAFPVSALSFEHYVTGQILSHKVQNVVQGGLSIGVTLLGFGEMTPSNLPKHSRLEEASGVAELGRGRQNPAISPP